LGFLFFGPPLLRLLHIGQPALYLSGGVLLFLIALGMIFPGTARIGLGNGETAAGEPFIVPLATPLVAGPSTVATIMIFVSHQPDRLRTAVEPPAGPPRPAGLRAVDGHDPDSDLRADVSGRDQAVRRSGLTWAAKSVLMFRVFEISQLKRERPKARKRLLLL